MTNRQIYMKKRDRRIPKICPECGEKFLVEKGTKYAKWCNKCKIVICNCKNCNKRFTVKRSEYNDGRGKFCSRKCAAQFTPKGENSYLWKGGLRSDPEYSKNHREKNRKKYAFYSRHRTYMKKSSEGSHTFEQWENLKKKYNYMCLCCKRYEPEITLTEDHIIPLYAHGSDFIENIQPLCRSCNSIKHTKTINFIETYDREKLFR